MALFQRSSAMFQTLTYHKPVGTGFWSLGMMTMAGVTPALNTGVRPYAMHNWHFPCSGHILNWPVLPCQTQRALVSTVVSRLSPCTGQHPHAPTNEAC